MKKKTLQIQPVQEAAEVQPAQVTPFRELSISEMEEARRLELEQDDNEALQIITDRVREVAKMFGLSVREIWDEVLNGALDFRHVETHGGCDGTERLHKGSERLHMNTAGDCLIETRTHSKFVSLRQSVQWQSEMHDKKPYDGSHDQEMMAEWLHRVAGEMR